MNILLQQHPSWCELVRKTWEQAFLRLTQIVLSVQTINAKGRYEHLFNNHEVKQKPLPNGIDSLLGVTDPSLSKK